MDLRDIMARSVSQVKAYVQKVNSKAKSRSLKRSRKAAAELKALPKLRSNKIPANYKNPVTLSPVRGVVYRVTNRGTGRKNYYTKATLEKLIGRKMSNYALLMASPKSVLFRNPATRGSVYPRNIMRVKV
jgi:hypothetical protein